MSERERALAREVQELKRAVAAQSEIVAAVRRGCAEAMDTAARELAKAQDEVALARAREAEGLAGVSRAQEHTGAVYRRIKDVDSLVVGWEKQLPPGFVAEVRALTRPDFAELLGVDR